MITIQGLHKRYGRRPVLAGLDCSIDAGEVVALAGDNGAGKTTTLGILMGFLEPTAGRVRVLGMDPLGRRHLGGVGWMPERPAFPRRFRLHRLLALGAATFPGWDPALAARLAERLELDLGQRTDRLSRGQTARLALLLALAHHPRLLILDDPTLGLDPAGRRLLLGELLATAADSGCAVLIATHLLAEADWSLDRLLILKHGRLVVDEDVETLRARCRRLLLPPGAPAPEGFGRVETDEGDFLTAFDPAAWARYHEAVPAARAEPAGLEDLYLALQEDA